MAPKRVDIISEDKILRALFRDPITRRQIASRVANVARNVQRQKMKYDDPSYPFAAKTRNQKYRGRGMVTLDKSKLSKGTIQITHNAPSAKYVEFGNKPANGGNIKTNSGNKLKIRTRKGTTIQAYNGKRYKATAYLYLNEVRPARAQHILRDAIKRVFGRL